MPSIMVVYWICNNLLSMIAETVAGKILRKDYETMRLAQEKQALEEKEEERRQKEQKLKEIQQRKEEKTQNKGKGKSKKKSQKKIEEAPLDKTASREGLRSYARGRAYDPNRYPNPNLIGPNGEIIPEEFVNIPQDSTIERLKSLETPEIPQDEGYEEILLESTSQEEEDESSYVTMEQAEHSFQSTSSQEDIQNWDAQKQVIMDSLNKDKSNDEE